MSHSRLLPVVCCLITAACALLLVGGCQERGAVSPDLVAISDLGDVTKADLERYILSRSEELQRPRKGQSLAQWRQSMVEGLVLGQALAAAADASDPVVVEGMFQARERTLLGMFRQRFIEERIQVSEEDLRQFYEEHPEDFGHSDQIRLSHIYRRISLSASAGERAELRQEMEQMLARLREGASFGDLARNYSDSETAHLDGLIGRLSRGALDPSLEDIVWNLEEGEISDVVETPAGFHIFKLDQRFEPFKMDFGEARGRLRKRLEREERERLTADLFAEALDESDAEYFPKRLDDKTAGRETVLFALGDRQTITVGDAEAYVLGSRFRITRETPPKRWLENAAQSELFLWKAEQVGLAEAPEVAELLNQVERNELINIALNERVQGKIEQLEAQGAIEEYFEKNSRRFQGPRTFDVRLVVLNFEDLERPYDAYEQLVQLAAQIRSGDRDMAEAAREISDDPSAARGGEVGWVVADEFASWAGPRAQKSLLALKPGEVSEPILIELYDRSRLTYERQGYMLIRVEEISEPRVPELLEVRDRVSAALAEARRSELEAEIKAEVLDSVNFRIIGENL